MDWYKIKHPSKTNVDCEVQMDDDLQQCDNFWCLKTMMTSSNGNIFRVTGPLCGEFTGPGEFPAQMPVTRSFDVFFDLRLNKRLSKQPWGWWFETPAWSLWRQRNAYKTRLYHPWHIFNWGGRHYHTGRHIAYEIFMMIFWFKFSPKFACSN